MLGSGLLLDDTNPSSAKIEYRYRGASESDVDVAISRCTKTCQSFSKYDKPISCRRASSINFRPPHLPSATSRINVLINCRPKRAKKRATGCIHDLPTYLPTYLQCICVQANIRGASCTLCMDVAFPLPPAPDWQQTSIWRH